MKVFCTSIMILLFSVSMAAAQLPYSCCKEMTPDKVSDCLSAGCQQCLAPAAVALPANVKPGQLSSPQLLRIVSYHPSPHSTVSEVPLHPPKA